jgi:aspartokinase-like uncharacterized kinase
MFSYWIGSKSRAGSQRLIGTVYGAAIMSTPLPIRVIKLGGSLLDWSEWSAQFRAWFDVQPLAANVLMVGGGRLADDVRRRDRVERLDPTNAHWLAVDAMATNMATVRELLPEAIPTDRYEELPRLYEPGVLIAFCPRDFLRRVELQLPGEILPHSWDVTSDSIAARLAAALRADELVLLKSTAPPNDGRSIRRAAECCYVDRGFPRFAKDVARLRFCNMRAKKPTIVFACLVSVLVSTCASCSKQNNQEPVYPVVGKVTYNGSPASGAVVYFRRKSDIASKAPTIVGIVQNDGSFEMVSGPLGIGAPAGDYDVLEPIQ